MKLRIEIDTPTRHPGVITWREVIDAVTECAPVDHRTPVYPGPRHTRNGTITVESADE